MTPFPALTMENLLKSSALTLAYAAMARWVLTFSLLNGNLTILWLPAGLALAALIVWGWQFWPAVFIGAWVAGILVDDPWSLSAIIAAGNTLETVLAALLLQRLRHFDARLTKNGDFVNIVWVGLLCAMVSTAIGPVALFGYGYVTEDRLLPTLFQWWQSDVIGIVLGTPFFLV